MSSERTPDRAADTPELPASLWDFVTRIEESSDFLNPSVPSKPDSEWFLSTSSSFGELSSCLKAFEDHVRSLGLSEEDPFSVFLHTCLHEIRNPMQGLMLMCEQPEIFDPALYEKSRQKIVEGIQLLRSGEPLKANFNLKGLVEGLAAPYGMRVLCTGSYDVSSEVRLSPVTLKWVLENLKRGADTANGHPANVTLVLDSDPGVDGAPPQLRVYFVSDCEDTPLTPVRFYKLIENPPKSGQRGGRGIHYTNKLLTMAQRSSYVGDGEPCLRFRKKDTPRPLLLRDHDILALAASPSSFLFEINLSGVRVRVSEKRFDDAFDQAVHELALNDPVLKHLDLFRSDVAEVLSGGKGIDELLTEVADDVDRDVLRFLVEDVRQHFRKVAA